MFFLFLAGINGFIQAQQQVENPQFNNISVKDGLSQGTVHCIFQDKSGFIWVGTGDGLNKYDGYRFTTFKHQKGDTASISNNIINCITEDRQGHLWIGTTEGLNCYNPETNSFKRYLHISGNDKSLSNNYVKSLLIDKEGNLWIGTDLYLNRFNPHTEEFKKYNFNGLLEHSRIYVIIQDSYGDIWLGTQYAGLIRFTPRSLRFKQYKHSPANPTSINAGPVYTIYEDSHRRVWVGTWEQGVNKYDRDRDCFERIATARNGTGLNSAQIRCIAENSDSTLWIGTSEGLNIYYPDKHTFRYCQRHNNVIGSLSYNIVNCIYQDRQGCVWLGTHGGGIDLHTALSGQFKHIDPQIQVGHNYGFIGPLTECQGKLWIGTEGGGLANYDLHTHAYRHFDLAGSNGRDLNSNTIRALCVDANNRLWIGTYAAGIQAFDTGKQTFDNRYDIGHAIINDIFRDSRGNIWVGANTEKGVYLKEKDKDYFTCGVKTSNKPPVHFPWIRTICEAGNGEIWFGSIYSGIFIWNEKQEVQRMTTENSALSSNYISVLFRDSRNQLWIGTSGGGINIYNPKSREIKTLTTANGLLNDNICSIVEDSRSNIWISTVSGISFYRRSYGSFTNYSYARGNFPIETLNLKAGVLTADGEIYFGGNNGLAHFKPGDIFSNTILPPVLFTRLSVNNKEVQVSDNTGILTQSLSGIREITLRYNQTDITVEFAALNYIFPQNNQYSYYLEGYDLTWNTPGFQRSATYTNLPSGKYTLKVKASNNSGLWNEAGTQLVIRVLPAPWATTGAYLLYFLLALLLLYVAFRYSVSKMKLRNELRIQEIENQTIQQSYKMHINLFTNFSHELRTPLTLILGPLKKHTTDITLPANVRESLMLAYKNAQRMLILVNQLLDLRKQEVRKVQLKVEAGNFTSFIKEIVIFFRELAHSKQIELTFRPDDQELTAYFDPFLMEKVFYNLLSNAIKNTPQKGSIKLKTEYILPADLNRLPFWVKAQLDKASSYFLFSIKDTGKGIPEKDLENIFLPFFQVSENTSPDSYGTGIGLPICRNIVRLHRGRMWARNNEVRGACFYIVLPIKKALFTSRELAEPDAEPYAITPALLRKNAKKEVTLPLTGKKGVPAMLIIDDNEDIRTYLKAHFREEYNIYEAANGKEGIEIAGKLMPDIIISDIMMPLMDGLQLCYYLKNDVKTSHIPLILLTAKTSVPNMQEGFFSGADDYITKPFDIILLTARIKSLIENRERIKRAFSKKFSVSTVDYSPVDNDFLARAQRYIRDNMDKTDFSIEEFGNELFLSRTQLYRKIKALTGMSPSMFVSTYRLKVAAEMLRNTSFSIMEIAYKTGFNSPSYFTSCFKKLYNVSPSEYAGKERRNF